MSKPVKVMSLTVVIAVAVVVLFLYVFPWVEAQQQDPTLGAPAAPAAAVVAQEPTSQLTRSPR